MKLPMPGTIINGPRGKMSLKLGEPLGGGAFGVVFIAHEIETGTVYAVKFPQYAVFGGQSELSAFFNEVQASKLIDHPNVVKVLYAETEESDLPPYLVMEYIEDGTLKRRLDAYRNQKKLVEVNNVLLWAYQLVDGMSAINTHMLHRDIKADNIMMRGNNLLISDFGLSKIVGALTRTLTFKGGQHIFYMAPEGWKMETNNIQLDMYAVGIVLYEIATLCYPYKIPANPSDIIAIQNMHLYQTAMNITEYRNDLPTNFIQIINRLMEKRPEDRFKTWDEVRAALDKVNGSTKNMKVDSPKPLIESLMKVSGEAHEAQVQKQLEEERKRNEAKEQMKLDEYQRDRLTEIIDSAINEYNESSTVNKIEKHSSWNTTGAYSIPHGGAIRLGFFSIEPPLKLRLGYVRYAACITDEDGGGLNYLLCRDSNEDIYGRWIACYVSQSPLVDPQKMPPRKVQPFGFNNSTDIKHIERADRAMHVYNVSYSEGNDKIKESVLELALDMIRRKL